MRVQRNSTVGIVFALHMDDLSLAPESHIEQIESHIEYIVNQKQVWRWVVPIVLMWPQNKRNQIKTNTKIPKAKLICFICKTLYLVSYYGNWLSSSCNIGVKLLWPKQTSQYYEKNLLLYKEKIYFLCLKVKFIIISVVELLLLRTSSHLE